MTDPRQAAQLFVDCGLNVSAVNPNGRMENVNVLNSSAPNVDPDLLSPHESCGGNGEGAGGEVNTTYENCVPQGNLLIIQKSGQNASIPDDRKNGGTMTFTFADPVQLVNMGILDADENITVVVSVVSVECFTLACAMHQSPSCCILTSLFLFDACFYKNR